METPNLKPSFIERNAALIKGFFIAVLCLVLLIPTLMIFGLINEREGRKDEAVKDVSAKWGNRQTLVGPVLQVPYYEISEIKKVNAAGKKETELTKKLNYAYFLPNNLIINGNITPEKRHRGIYEIIVYGSKLSFSGDFSAIDYTKLGIQPETIAWKDAALLVSISDFRGIKDNVTLNWNGQPSVFNSGATLAYNDTPDAGTLSLSAIYSPVQVANDGKSPNTFRFDIALKGSENISFVPVGKTSVVTMKSNWPHPSFDGSFLPDTSTVTNTGFVADWKVLHLNRDFPQQWTGNTPNLLTSSTLGISLITPNDAYQKTSRSVKYAILIIALTFMAFFFTEILNQKRVHPLNYILIGLALCIFYTLLLSISEFISFNSSYWIATAMTIGLVFLYSKSIFQQARPAALVSLVMLILYGFIFVIIQLEDTALLIGSIGLFLILAITMYISRKIDWANIGIKKQ
jgi:inner membrane protein